MSTIRRVYIYLVSAISLQGAVWALISLLRNFTVTRLDPNAEALAFQIAVLVVGIPVFLMHWLWGQRLANQELEERGAVLRRFYLYANQAGFLAPLVTNLYDLLGSILRASGSLERLPGRLTPVDGIIYHLVAILVLGAMWFYHHRVLAEDQRTQPDQERNSTIRRLLILGFSAAGLVTTTLGVIHLIRWIMLQFGARVVSSVESVTLPNEITRLLIGVPLWLLFWRWAGRLFEHGGEEERESALRKFYLYGAVFAGTLGVVGNIAAILAGVLRRVLSLPPEGDIRGPLPIVFGMAVVWAYHAFVLRADSEKITELPRQAGIRRLSLYLVAFIGLSALLTGIAGNLSVLIRSFDQGFGNALREQLAIFTAALIAGLPVWYIPWTRAQAETRLPEQAGVQARQSLVRKLYLYFFLFVGTMTILGSVIYLVFGVLVSVFGGDPPSFSELAHAIAYSLIAAGVLAYHGIILREDGKELKTALAQRLDEMKILILDVGDGSFSKAITEALNRENPGLNLTPLLLPPSEPGETGPDASPWSDQIAQAGLIVAPWPVAISGLWTNVPPALSQALTNSPARKLLAPTMAEGWDWAGMDRWNLEQRTQQTLRAIQQILEGELVKAHRPMGIGTIMIIIIGGLIILNIVASLIGSLFFGGF